jgi:hypothetical protein
MLTIALMLVVISNHASAGTNAITICRNTVSAKGELAVPAHDAIVRGRPSARRTRRGTRLTGCTTAETPIRAYRSSARYRLYGVAFGTIIGILGEALFARDADAAPVRARLATQFAYRTVAVPIEEESGCARRALSAVGRGGPASVARALPVGAANAIETIACRRGIGASRGKTAACTRNTVVASGAAGGAGLA